MKHATILSVAALAGALAAALPALAADDHSKHQSHQDHSKHQKPPVGEKPTAVKVKYDDSVLTDQFGKQQKLKTDVFGDRIVVMDFIYTTCTTICPVLSALMSKVQNELGDGARGEVQFVSLSVDPARDTPAKMKEYAGKYGAKPGWLWLTGPTGRVNEVLKGFGAYAPNFEDHPPLILVGDTRSGNWTRFFGFSDPKDVIAKVEELRAARKGAAAAAPAKEAQR